MLGKQTTNAHRRREYAGFRRPNPKPRQGLVKVENRTGSMRERLVCRTLVCIRTWERRVVRERGREREENGGTGS